MQDTRVCDRSMHSHGQRKTSRADRVECTTKFHIHSINIAKIKSQYNVEMIRCFVSFFVFE